MADDTNLGVARARESDVDSNKSDRQHQMEQPLEFNAQAGSETIDAFADQNRSANESAKDILDWRDQVRKHPVAWGLGALGFGLVVGYGLWSVLDGEDERTDSRVSDADGGYDRDVASPGQFDGGRPGAFSDQHSYDVNDRAVERVEIGLAVAGSPVAAGIDNALASRPSYSSGYEQTPTVRQKPGLIGRIKGTRAYDRLQEEVSDLGSRFMDELANAARTLVLPAIFNKIKEMIGIDLSNKDEQSPASNKKGPIEAPVALDINPSVSGKPAYPKAKESLNKFERLASDHSTTSGQSDHSPHLNLNYDDRYERESKLFSRGENRGFAPETPGMSKPPATDVPATDNDDLPRGKDFTFQAGHTEDN